MFWVRIRLGGREYLGVLDTGATISIVANKILPCGSLKNTMTTAAIRMGDGHVVHSCGDCEVEVPMGSRTIAHRFYVMDTEAFDFVLGTDFFVQHSQIQSLTLQAPYLLYVDHGSGRESVPLEQSEHTSSYLRLSKEEPLNMMAASKTEDYQLLWEVLDQGLKELGYSREDLSVELFASDKQHVLGLYCSKGKNCSYKFYWPSFGMAYGNPRFSELGKVPTKVALERSRMVLCSPDWGAHGDRLRPQDAVETTPGGDEYVVTDTNAPNSPCHVLVPDGVSECGLSELPSSIHSDDVQHASDCEQRDCFVVQGKLPDNYRCTITCAFCGKRKHYEDECYHKQRLSAKLRGEDPGKGSGKGGGKAKGNDSGKGKSKGRGQGGQDKGQGGRGGGANRQPDNKNKDKNGGNPNPNPGGNSEPSGGQSGPTTRSQTQAKQEQGAKREHEGGDDGNAKKRSRFMRMARKLRNKGFEVTCPAEF